MAERIINITCPNCKHGIKHDTLLDTTKSIAPEEYPVINDNGKCWCKSCQHGTYPDEEGMCTECILKGRATRLRPTGEKLVNPKSVIEKEIKEEIITNTIEEVKEVKKAPAKKTIKTKK